MPPAPTPPGPTPTATGSEFRLSWIDHPALPAHGLGLCRCPGSRDGVWVPPSLLAQDLGHLAGLGISSVVSLIDADECRLIGVPSLAAQAVAAGLDWRDFPITDRAVPEPDQAAAFQQLLADLSVILDEGARLAIHCRAGLGRSGLLAAALLVWRGVAADEAIAAIRRCRPGAIETEGQERYIRSLA